MERRFAVRMRQILDDTVVEPAVFNGARQRLERFVEPFAACLREAEQRKHTLEYVSGLISRLERKTTESIAYWHDQERQGLQKFLSQAPWDHRPLVHELARQIGAALGEPDAVLVFDPSAHPKKGTASVGVQRQWCGRLGKVDNCQVGVYLGYVSQQEHALVDVRLFLPEAWATDKQRRNKAGVPRSVRFRTRHELALDMLDEQGRTLPHGWVAGDDEMGRSTRFRRELQARNERYLLAVPCNTLVRDLDAPPPPYAGRGRRPQSPFQRVERWRAALPKRAWTRIEVRPGEKGPLEVEAAKARVTAKTERRRAGAQEILVVFRERQADGTIKHDYCLSNAAWDTPLAELARVFKAEHRIEECLQRAKSEAGLSHYEVRLWSGWHRHQTLSLMAAWFLTQETRRGKKMDASAHGSATALGHRAAPRPRLEGQHHRDHLSHQHATTGTQRTGAPVLLEEPQPLAAAAG
jgi:SRSO17 transposase